MKTLTILISLVFLCASTMLNAEQMPQNVQQELDKLANPPAKTPSAPPATGTSNPVPIPL